MWTVVVFLNLLGALHFKVSCSPLSPTNVIFSSVNLRNVLQWHPGGDTPDDTEFTVQYAIYGDSVVGSEGRRVHWRAVQRCTKIVRSWCDLSNETWDLDQGYHARVRAVTLGASSKWVRTKKRFDPKMDTIFGCPLVSVEIEDNNAIISLKGPMRYQPNNYTPVVSMAKVYPDMNYNLSIENTRGGQIHHFPKVSSPYTFRLMEYDTEYCFSARSSLESMPAQYLPSAWHCITTPKDPVIGQLQQVVVGIVVPSVCMCMLVVVGYLLHRYLSGKGQKSPFILNLPTFHPPPLTFPPENPKLIVITIIQDQQPESDTSHSACPKKPTNSARPPPGYASQRPQTPPAPEETWDDFSVDYGFLAAASKIDLKGGNGNNLKCKGASMRKVKGEEEERVLPGLVINTTPQTGFFHIPFNLLAKKEGGMGEEMDGNMRVGTDGEMDGRESEVLPLLSSYASQNTMLIPNSDLSDDLPDDYGLMTMNTAHNIEEEEEEEEEEGTLCIDWDPLTGKLVLPDMEFNKEGVWDGMMQGEKGRENRIGGEEEEEMGNLRNGELRLENVFVRQGSEEKAEAERELEGGGEDFLTRWDLVISMDK
ncbi:hypothetical protein PBY51_006929 [Eleginops maclovinus]|uniref:Uncharacterized protein n=1 Tax=Eleginops maclovinus TaxID=56733 RepID=A0AAN7X2K1_ELEMC|nr:hypothetical protein PBY51_006929 [Eleginops maclovinus]